MQGIRKAGRIVSLAITVLLAALLLCNCYVLLNRAITGNKSPSVFGYSTAVVVSGSMSGAIEVNDMVIIHREDSYEVGDVITFDDGSVLVTHRIAAVETDESGQLQFITKGDANNTADQEPVSPEQVAGKVVFVLSGVGIVQEFIQTRQGMICLALTFSLLAVILFLQGRRQEKENEPVDIGNDQKIDGGKKNDKT